jgi:hypothetical protein
MDKKMCSGWCGDMMSPFVFLFFLQKTTDFPTATPRRCASASVRPQVRLTIPESLLMCSELPGHGNRAARLPRQ